MEKIILKQLTLDKYQQLIKKGKEWAERKTRLGWQETPIGLLSMREIQKAGFIYKDGEYRIPIQEHIAKDSEAGHRKGQKYFGISQQYLNWKKNKKYYKTVDNYIDDEITQGTSFDDISFK